MQTEAVHTGGTRSHGLLRWCKAKRRPNSSSVRPCFPIWMARNTLGRRYN